MSQQRWRTDDVSLENRSIEGVGDENLASVLNSRKTVK
jgi:hypothetical protein